MTDHTYTMTERYAAAIHEMAKTGIATLHNHIAVYVKKRDWAKAEALVDLLREKQDIFAAFNIAANHEIAGVTGKPLETAHTVRPRR